MRILAILLITLYSTLVLAPYIKQSKFTSFKTTNLPSDFYNSDKDYNTKKNSKKKKNKQSKEIVKNFNNEEIIFKEDAINDFVIEGMSIDDSLLEYISEKKIKENIIELYEYYEDQTFTTVELYKDPNLKTYDSLQIIIKRNDKEYKIYSLMGAYHYEYNIDECYSEMELIISDISNYYNSLEIIGPIKRIHQGDPSGKSSYTGYYTWLENEDSIWVECYDWDEEIYQKEGWTDHLRLSVSKIEFTEWLWQ